MSKKIIIPLLIIIAVLIGIIVSVQRVRTPDSEIVPTPTTSTPQTNTPTPENLTPTPTPSTQEGPSVTTPKPNTKVNNPVTVTGIVPPGWMFEGVFPVKLLDAERNVIAQTQGREVTPGSWNSGNDVAFRATVDFTTSAKSGFLVLEKDNPSGLPENEARYEIPVTF